MPADAARRGPASASKRKPARLHKSRRARVRYSDIYNRVYKATATHTLDTALRDVLHTFQQSPGPHSRVPYLVHTLMTTQLIGTRARESGATSMGAVEWALRLARFVRERAARAIMRSALDFLWRAGGPMYRKTLNALVVDGLIRPAVHERAGGADGADGDRYDRYDRCD